jgi:hypothetical protein
MNPDWAPGVMAALGGAMTVPDEQELTVRPAGTQAQRQQGEKRAISGLPVLLRTCLPFFALSFVYLWLVIQPDLLYYGFGTILPEAAPFATGWAFLKETLALPGGPAAYLCGFLAQGYSRAWLGALTIVLAGFALTELSRRHLARAGLAHAAAVAGLPAVVFFLLYSRYRHPLTIGLVVALGLLLSLAFERLPRRRFWLRGIACCLLAVLGFWLGGGGTLLVFAVLSVIYAVFAPHPGWVCTAHQQPSDAVPDGVQCTPYRLGCRDGAVGALALAASIVLAWALARYVFLLSAREALLTLTPFAPTLTMGMDTLLMVLTYLLYGFVPATVLLGFIAARVSRGRRHQAGTRVEKTPGKTKRTAREGQRRMPVFRSLFSVLRSPAVGPTVLLALGLYFSHDALRKSYVLSNYYSCQGRWDRILELGRRLPPNRNNVYVNHDITRALYHTGRLLYDMFRYPQDPQALLLTHERQESDLTQWKLSDIFLELGHVNMAERLASELVTTKGHFGPALDKLGWISIIKGSPATARVYLSALTKDLVYRRRAQSLLHGLDHGFTPEQAAYLDGLRAGVRDEPAGVTGREPVDQTLAALLAHNPRNRMAFEYLMACHLLTGRVDRIVESAGRLRDLGYPQIPTLCEEAILIHFGTQGREIDLARFPVNPETLRRYEAFVQLSGAMQAGNHPAVLDRLIRNFGASYFFYYSFGRVGLTPR